MVGAAGFEVSPGHAHWKTGVLFTAPSRVTEQVRETDSPAMGEEVDEEREIIRSCAGKKYMNCVKMNRTGEGVYSGYLSQWSVLQCHLMVCCWTQYTGSTLPVSQSQSVCGCTVQLQGHPTQSSLLRLPQNLWPK